MPWPTSSTFVAGAVLTAAQQNALRADVLAANGYKEKTADQSVTSSTTLVNDTHLAYAIPGTGTYLADLWLYGVSATNAAGNLKIGFSFPSGTLHFSALGGSGIGSSGVGSTDFTANLSVTSGVTSWAYSLSTTAMGIYVRARLAATASGTLQLMWAQNVSNASASTLKAGSHMTIRQVA